MFEIGSASGSGKATPEIILVEDSKVLEELLPFIYSRPLDSEQSLFERLGQPVVTNAGFMISLHAPSNQGLAFSTGVCNFLKACDKYEVG